MLDGPSSRPGEPKAANDSRLEILPLRTSDDFRRVLSTGRRRKIGEITVVWAPGRSRVRVGLIAGKRIGNAVQRNRAKRRLRQAVIQAELPAGDYVILAGPASVSVPFNDLVAWVSQGGARSGQ